MYFCVTLILGIIILYIEVQATRTFNALARDIRRSLKWSIFALLVVLGLACGSVFAFMEYPSPFKNQSSITFYSFPVLAGATDGKKDYLGIFTIPAILLNFAIGSLAPMLVATVLGKNWFVKKK